MDRGNIIAFDGTNMASFMSLLLYGTSSEWGEPPPPPFFIPANKTILPLEPSAAGVMDGRVPT